jgi:hypothetical protein
MATQAQFTATLTPTQLAAFNALTPFEQTQMVQAYTIQNEGFLSGIISNAEYGVEDIFSPVVSAVDQTVVQPAASAVENDVITPIETALSSAGSSVESFALIALLGFGLLMILEHQK